MTGPAEGARRAPPAEVLRQVRRLELTARGLVNAAFAGEYRSVFTGQGMEFAEVREYQAGDEVRAIDWNVTARMGRPFTRRYVEERERTVMVAVDASASVRFATAGRFKAELAAEFAAVVALCAIRSNDRVGGLLFTDRIEHLVPPAKGRRHVLRLVRDLMAIEPAGRGTDVGMALDALTGLATHRAIVFVVSDFASPGFEGALARLAQRHDAIAVPVEDPAERLLPDAGLVRFVDPEDGTLVEVDTSDPTLREAYAEAACERREARSAAFRRAGVEEIPLRTDRGYARELLSFFRRRAGRRGGRKP